MELLINRIEPVKFIVYPDELRENIRELDYNSSIELYHIFFFTSCNKSWAELSESENGSIVQDTFKEYVKFREEKSGKTCYLIHNGDSHDSSWDAFDYYMENPNHWQPEDCTRFWDAFRKLLLRDYIDGKFNKTFSEDIKNEISTELKDAMADSRRAEKYEWLGICTGFVYMGSFVGGFFCPWLFIVAVVAAIVTCISRDKAKSLNSNIDNTINNIVQGERILIR